MSTPTGPAAQVKESRLGKGIMIGVLVGLALAAGVFGFNAILDAANATRAQEWRQKLSDLGMEYSFSVEKIEGTNQLRETVVLEGPSSEDGIKRVIAVLDKFEQAYVRDGEYKGQGTISFSHLQMLRSALGQKRMDMACAEFLKEIPKGLLPLGDSAGRDERAKELCRSAWDPMVKEHILRFHANQFEYALLALYLFPAEPSNWREVDQLFERIKFEKLQLGDAVVTQDIFKLGPPTLEEAQRLRDLALKRVLIQLMKNLRAEKYSYPDSAAKVAEFRAIFALTSLTLKDFETSDKELEQLRQATPLLPREVRLIEEAKKKVERRLTQKDRDRAMLRQCMDRWQDDPFYECPLGNRTEQLFEQYLESCAPNCQMRLHPEDHYGSKCGRTKGGCYNGIGFRGTGRIQGLGKIDTGMVRDSPEVGKGKPNAVPKTDEPIQIDNSVFTGEEPMSTP